MDEYSYLRKALLTELNTHVKGMKRKIHNGAGETISPLLAELLTDCNTLISALNYLERMED